MIVIVKSDKQKNYATKLVSDLSYDHWHTVEIKPYSPDRSLAQNSLLHMWCSNASKSYAESHGEYYTPDAWKIYFKSLFLGYESKKTPMGVVEQLRNTSKLSQKKFAKFLNEIEDYCGSEQITLRHPFDYRLAMHGEA